MCGKLIAGFVAFMVGVEIISNYDAVCEIAEHIKTTTLELLSDDARTDCDRDARE